MTPDRAKVDALFAEALDVPAVERDAFLARAANEDPAALAEVRSLLAAHERAGGVLEHDPFEAPWLDDPPRLPPRLGPWRVGSELGRGGMGVVYLADRADGQFERRVAIKVLGGALSQDLTQRLDVERRILAALDHPNIARLLDAGVTDEGRPYLVMEYVDGQPLDRWCDRRQLPIAERLRVFCTIAHAVQHAHQNLVVHRDLKPSNILVTSDGTVKLLDFGIAKLLERPGAYPEGPDGPQTRTGLRLMTPEYASPEQVRGDAVTTVSDVYALGVVLYELLTGRRPFRMEGQTVGDWERALLEEEPKRPSDLVLAAPEPVGRDGHRPETPETVSRARGTTPDRLARALRGDLDRIALMALRKEPERRYASAEQLAEDVERYLDGLPVRAHTDSRWYVVRKYIRRHRIQTTAAALVTLSIVGGLGAALWQAGVASRARDRAEAARVQAEQVSGFLIGLFEGGDPAAGGASAATARDLLRRGVEQAEALHDQPTAQARMFDAIARVYDNLGELEEARKHYERALSLWRRAHPGDHLGVALALTHLGTNYRRRAQYATADSLYQEALAMQRRLVGDVHPDVAVTLTDLGRSMADQGRDRESELFWRQALTVRQAAFGPEHPEVATSLRNVGAILRRMGRLDEAEPFYREAYQMRLRLFGPEHIETANFKAQLAILLSDRPAGLAEAEQLHREVLEVHRRTNGDLHPSVANALGQLSAVLAARGRLEEAEALIREGVAIRERIYGRDNPGVGGGLGQLGNLLVRTGRYAAAESLYRENMAIYSRAFGPDHPSMIGPTLALAELLALRGHRNEAERYFREALAIREQHAAPGSLLIAVPAARLGGFLLDQGKYAEAEPILLKAWTIQRDHLPPGDTLTRQSADLLVQLYERWGRGEEAARYRN